MRNASIPGQKSVVDRLYGKFAPAQKPDRSNLTLDQVRQQDADEGKRIAQRDEISPRAYQQNRPGNISYQPQHNSDDRDVIIKQASRILLDDLQDKIGKGGIELELADNGFKVSASVETPGVANHQTIKRARAVFQIKFKTAMPQVSRVAFASVEFDASKSNDNQYCVSECMRDARDVNKKIAMMSKDISEFINSDSKRFEGSGQLTRMASRQENLGENPYDAGRKLVIRDWTNPEITAYVRLAVRNVEKSVGVLKANGIQIEKRVFDASFGSEEVQGPVYEIVTASANYKNVDSMLRSAGEFTLPSREVKNDEAPNKARGEVFSNEKQIDEPSKFPGRSSEKEKPSYKNATPENWAKDSEDKAYKQDENDDPKKWPGRTSEKNDEGVKGALPKNPKPHSDEKPNKEGKNPNMPGPGSNDSPSDWPNRSLEAGSSFGVGEMMKYDRYRHQRTAQVNATPLGSYNMNQPLGKHAQEAPFGGGADEAGALIDDKDVQIGQGEGGQVVLLVPKEKLIDLGKVGGGTPAPAPIAEPPAPAGGMTTPQDKGLPGAVAQKKEAEGGGKVPMPLGNAKVQEKPKISKDCDSMDGMDHGKSADEGNTPKVVPTKEFKQNKPQAKAILMRFPQASTCFAVAQRLAVKASEAANGGKVLTRQQFAEATRLAQFMVGKEDQAKQNPYVLTLAHLPSDDPLAKFMCNAMQKIAVPGGSGGAPNAKAPESKGKEDKMDGLDHGKSDAGDSTDGFKTTTTPEAKDDVIGGINKNPEEPNTKKNSTDMDGLNHGKSSGGEAKVVPSQEYKGENPVKPMKSEGKFKDFREELLSHMSGAEAKNQHRVFASLRGEVDQQYANDRAEIMNKFSRFELSDVQVTGEIEKIDALKNQRVAVLKEARDAIYRKAKREASKKEAKDGKPESQFKVPDVKNEYNHQKDQWWDRALEGQELQSGHVGEMGLKEDEGKALDTKLYDKPDNFVGRTVEKPGGVPAKDLSPLRSDENKAFGHEEMYDSPENWVGRAAEKGWNSPTSNDFMMKSERKNRVESNIKHALGRKESEYVKPEFTPVIVAKMLEIGGLSAIAKKGSEKIDIIEIGANEGRQYCYGVRSIEALKEIIDLHARGLNPHEITLHLAKKTPDQLVNVVDIVEAYRTAKVLTKKDAGGGKPNPKSPTGSASGSSKQAAGSEDYNKTSYSEEKNDKIANEMPEQKSWQKGEISEADPKKGRSDQPGDLDKDQRPQPTISAQEPENQKETKGYDWKKESASEDKPKEKFNLPPEGDDDRKRRLCPECKGKGKDCKRCDGAGYLYEFKGAAANPFAVCTESVGREDKEKYERCVQDVKKKNKSEGAPEIPKSKKEGQVNEDVLPKEHREQGAEQQLNMVTKHMQPGNNVTYAANDTVYDNTGRFPKAEPRSPYTVAHITEQILIGLNKRVWADAQSALDGVAEGERFGRLSQAQLKLLTETLTAHGFKLKEPKARPYDPPTALKKK